jgi:hypothetical protein
MSRSLCAITRGQSVRDALEVDLVLTSRRLSHREDADVVVFLYMSHRHHDLAEKPQGDESLLTVRQAIILVGVRHAREHQLCITEVQPMLLEVRQALRLIPRDPLSSVYTFRMGVNRRRLQV